MCQFVVPSFCVELHYGINIVDKLTPLPEALIYKSTVIDSSTVLWIIGVMGLFAVCMVVVVAAVLGIILSKRRLNGN